MRCQHRHQCVEITLMAPIPASGDATVSLMLRPSLRRFRACCARGSALTPRESPAAGLTRTPLLQVSAMLRQFDAQANTSEESSGSLLWFARRKSESLVRPRRVERHPTPERSMSLWSPVLGRRALVRWSRLMHFLSLGA